MPEGGLAPGLELEDAVAIGAHDLAARADREEDARMAHVAVAAVAGDLGLRHLDDLGRCRDRSLDHACSLSAFPRLRPRGTGVDRARGRMIPIAGP